MYLRRHRRRKGGENYEYWTLVESIRTSRGPRQRTVATLGKLAGFDKDERAGRPEKVERQIGRWLGRNTAAENVFTVETIVRDGLAIGLRIEEDQSKLDWSKIAHGAYLLRTNCSKQYPCKLWRWYIHLTEVEDAFRVGKSDLGLRPVHHHREDRVQAHIMVCFMALAMWRTLEMWLKGKGSVTVRGRS
ncbi:MAG: hypothetical protein GF398_21835 [Chitinivibrionales bacterium]|nr:hypothetical protein [Chitinivibrionales bacterium]